MNNPVFSYATFLYILHYIVLYCIPLYVLHYIVLYCIPLYVLHYIGLYRKRQLMYILHYIVLYRISVHSALCWPLPPTSLRSKVHCVYKSHVTTSLPSALYWPIHICCVASVTQNRRYVAVPSTRAASLFQHHIPYINHFDSSHDAAQCIS